MLLGKGYLAPCFSILINGNSWNIMHIYTSTIASSKLQATCIASMDGREVLIDQWAGHSKNIKVLQHRPVIFCVLLLTDGSHSIVC